MPVRLRLARHGTRNNPFYHIVAIADHKPRDARPIEKLGEYDPIPRVRKYKPPAFNADAPVLSSGLPTHSTIASTSKSPAVGTSLAPNKPILEKKLEWNTERIKYWLQVGALPSKPVAKMLDKAGLIPEGKWFKGMYRPPTEGTHFNPTLQSATATDAATSTSSAKQSAPSSVTANGTSSPQISDPSANSQPSAAQPVN